VVALKVEVTHTNLTEVTRMVFVEIGAVVVLTTGHTTTTWVLAVLSYTSVTGGDMTAANIESVQEIELIEWFVLTAFLSWKDE
jgi:hypothetical protein